MLSVLVFISLRLGFRRNVCLYLHPTVVSSPIKGIPEILNLTSRCIPMDILAWTDCVGSSVGKNIINRHFPVQIYKNVDISLPFTAYIRQNNPKSTKLTAILLNSRTTPRDIDTKMEEKPCQTWHLKIATKKSGYIR